MRWIASAVMLSSESVRRFHSGNLLAPAGPAATVAFPIASVLFRGRHDLRATLIGRDRLDDGDCTGVHRDFVEGGTAGFTVVSPEVAEGEGEQEHETRRGEPKHSLSQPLSFRNLGDRSAA